MLRRLRGVFTAVRRQALAVGAHLDQRVTEPEEYDWPESQRLPVPTGQRLTVAIDGTYVRSNLDTGVLFFIDIVNRAVKIAAITPHPDSRWMTQIARNLTDPNDGFLRGKRYLILDRDTKYSDALRSVLVREGIQVVRLPARSPNLNAFAERFVRSIKEECLSRMIFFAPASLQHALRQFMAHYPTERNHQGLENRIPQPMSVAALPHHPVQRRQRLGGMLSYYHRVAA